MTIRAIDDHWMKTQPLDLAAWPNYRDDAARNGQRAADYLRAFVLVSRVNTGHVNGVLDSLEKFAIAHARIACRPAWIAIFGGMTLEELTREGF